MTRNRGNAIVKFIMIIAVAAIIFLGLDFWLGAKKDAEEVASGPAPVSETSEAPADSTPPSADSAASKAAAAARAAVASGMTLEEAREIGRSIGEQIGKEIGTEVGTQTAQALLEDQDMGDTELVADVSDSIPEQAPEQPAEKAAAPAPADDVDEEEVVEEAEPEQVAEPEPAPAPAPKPAPAPVAAATPPPPPAAPAPKPAPKPSKFWWTSAFVEGGMGVRFVGPYQGDGAGVAILFTSDVDAGSLPGKLTLKKGGSPVDASWEVSSKNAKMVVAKGITPGSYTLSIGSGIKGTDGKSVKRSASGTVQVK